MKNYNIPLKCVNQMLKKDNFSQWLGIDILEIKEGYAKIKMIIKEDMLNGFNIVHGGILFSFADSAFAFSCNTYNNLTLALNCTISFPRAGKLGDEIIAESKELDSTNRTGLYDIVITNQNNYVLARFRGTAYKTGKTILNDE